jgi:small subunit ribosomal protein S15
MLNKDEAATIVKEFGKSENDSGSTEVQVALLTRRITNLTPHFEKNKHDFHSKRGLLKMIGQRKALLRYLSNNDRTRYETVIKKLGLRK